MVEGFRNTEVGVIPEDWKIQKLGELANIIGGGTPSSFNRSFWNGNINWFTPTEIGKHKYTYESLRKITKLGYDNCSAKMLPIGTILLTTRAGIGDLSILKTEGCTNQGFQSFVSVDSVDNEFLYYLLSTLKSIFLQNASGSTFLEISPNKLRAIQVPLPPTKAEQTAIATALNDADALISSLEKLIAKKKAIKQGAMQELLKPKEGWDWTTVEKLGKPYGGLSGKSKNDFNSGNCPYIPFMNVMSNPIIDKSFLRYVKIGSSENQNKAMKGDIFFNGSSETPEELGMCSVLLEDIPNLYLNSFCFGFRLNKELGTDGLYLAYYFRSSFGRRIFTILAQGATRHNLSKANFNKIEFQLPKSVEQKRISEIIQDMDNEIFEYEKKLEKQKQLKQGMMQSLLTGKIRLV